MTRIDELRQRIASWGKEEYDRRDLIYKTRPKQLHKRKDRFIKEVKRGEESTTRFMISDNQKLKKGTRKTSGVLAEPSSDWAVSSRNQVIPSGSVEYSRNQPIRDSFVQESPAYKQYKQYPDAETQHNEEMAFIESGRKIQPRKPTRMEWRAIITAKQLRQRLARIYES